VAPADPDPIVAFIAGEHGMAARLLDAHVDDGTGRCRVCSGGAQTGRLRWPCRLHDYAIRARRAHASQQAAG
jgi:hypothetical protein